MTPSRRVGDRQSGFSLIELMIVLVIVAVLATIAYPAYREQVQSTRRADAQQALMGLAAAMERYHSQNLSYESAAVGDKDTGAPRIYASEAPLDGDRKYYDLRITSASVDDYTLQAQPKNDQDGDGFLQLTADGSRSWDRDNDDTIAASEQCWEEKC